MLLPDLILGKRGPLAKVWLAAHQERKLSKQATLGVDVPESVDAILDNDEEITLRVSGQLMLGVTRIYGRQVQYLVDDCKDVRERLARAFRPGVVDLPEEQITADRRAITLAEGDAAIIDIFDWTFVPPERQGGHTAPLNVTNLRRATEYGAFNFGRPAVPSIYARSSREASFESHSHLDSNDFEPIDLGLDSFDFDESMEIGRDAHERALSLPRTPVLPRGPDALDMHDDLGNLSFEPMDLGLDLPELDRASSELSTPPPASPEPVDVTPRTAKRIAVFAERRVKRVRLIGPDAELELDDDFGSPDEDTMDEPRFIPASEQTVRLRSFLADRRSFLPSVKVDGRELIFAGPPGLPRAVAGLFTFPSDVIRQGELELEVPRRVSRAPTDLDLLDMDMGGMDGFDVGMDTMDGMDMMGPIDTTDFNIDYREPSLARSRAESIARAVETESSADPLSVFEKVEPTAGFSRATGMAMGVLRREIEAIEAESAAEPSAAAPVQFASIARGASKRAASSFFFELLVLGTRDDIALSQTTAFGPISVSAKPGLWGSQ